MEAVPMPHCIVHVVEAEWLGAHRVRLRFDDGLAGEIDLAPHLDGPIFEPLREPERFARFSILPARTLSWDNGADLAPEFLHGLVRAALATPSEP